MKIVRTFEQIDGIPVFMGEGTLEDAGADKFKVGETIDQTRVIPGVSQVGGAIPITDAIVTTKQYTVIDVHTKKSESGTPILTVIMKEK